MIGGYTHRQQGGSISLLLFFQKGKVGHILNKDNRIKDALVSTPIKP
jgi:hypothetical protein